MTRITSRTSSLLLLIFLTGTGCATTATQAPPVLQEPAPQVEPERPVETDAVETTMSEEDLAAEADLALMADVRTALESGNEVSVEMAEQLLQRRPEDPYGRYLAGSILLRMGQIDDARMQFTRSAELDPDSDHAFSALGRIAEETGDLTQADLYYAKAYEAAPTPATANRLALLRIRGGYVESAREILNSTLENYPRDRMTMNNLAVALDLLGTTSEGIRILADDSIAETELLRTRALLQLKEGRPELAIGDLESASGPGDNGPWLLLGIADLQKGDLPKAEENFRRAIKTDPDRYEGYLNLGLTLRRQGKFADAAGIYKEGLRMSPHPDLHLNLGVLYELYRGEPALALQQYRKYLEQEGPAGDRVRGWAEFLEGVLEGP